MDATELNKEFEAWCRRQHEAWQKQPENHITWWPIWNPRWMFDKAEEIGRRWCVYIDPLAIEWWRARGYRFFYRDGNAYGEPFER